MNEGWLKLHRKSLDSRIFQNESLWRLWTWILLSVNYSESWADENTKVMPGQMLIGRNFIASSLNWSPSTSYDRLLKLEEWGMVKLESGSRGTLLTVCNWGTYQGSETEARQPTGSEAAADRQQPGSKPALNKKDNKTKKVKNTLFNGPEIIEEIYQAYPKNVAPKPAKKAISEALKKVNADYLLAAVKEFATAKEGADKQYLPNPATWFNAECWNDDRETWKCNRGSPQKVMSSAERREQNNIDAMKGFLNCGQANTNDTTAVRGHLD